MAQATSDERQASLDAAETTYEKVLNHFPDFSPVQRELAILYSRETAKTNRAYELAIKARETYPTDPALAKALGLILLQQGDPDRAAKLLNNSTAMNRSDAEAFFYLGTAQFQLKNRLQCKMALQQALALKLSAPQAAAAQQMLDKLK
jgi:predicted Zn-dependent protease